MNNENKEEKKQETEEKTFVYLYVAIGCFSVSVVLFALAIGLSYVVSGIGVYLLIASLISELASLSFLNVQKKHGQNAACKVFTVLGYVIMIAAVLVFSFGTAISGANA